MSTGSILSILAYPQYGYHLVYQTGLSLVHCSYLSVGSLQPDMLHTIYLGLFKHMMDWIQGFLKKTWERGGLRGPLESFAPLPGILCSRKGLQGGYALARKRDEESRVLFVGSSLCVIETA